MWLYFNRWFIFYWLSQQNSSNTVRGPGETVIIIPLQKYSKKYILFPFFLRINVPLKIVSCFWCGRISAQLVCVFPAECCLRFPRVENHFRLHIIESSCYKVNKIWFRLGPLHQALCCREVSIRPSHFLVTQSENLRNWNLKLRRAITHRELAKREETITFSTRSFP